jgi:hypothetical protein
MIRLLGLLYFFSFLLTACTTDAWRAGVQESAKQQCLQAPIGEQQRCLDRLNQVEKH